MGSTEMKAILTKLSSTKRRSHEGGGVILSPGCTFGAVVEQRLTGIERELAEVKGRLNGLIFLVAGAVLVEIVTRLVR